MACEHTQPSEVISMAEAHLQNRSIEPSLWEGFCMQFKENIDLWGHKAICIEVQRKNQNWVITKLDRLKEPFPDNELGTKILNDI